MREADIAGSDPAGFGLGSSAAARPARLRAAVISADASVRADGGETEPWRLVAASVAGTRHRLAGVGCEDAFAWALVEGPEGLTAVVAVGDGVGSVAGSARASAAAVAAATSAVAATLASGAPAPTDGSRPPESGAFGALVAGGVAAVGEAVTAADAAVADAGGATTLVVAAVGPGGRGWVARIGDSSALVLSGADWSGVWDAPEDSDVPASTATAALPGSDPQVEVAAVELRAGQALVLVTDGVGDPLRDGPTTVAPALADGLAGRPRPAEVAELIDFSRRGCLDDRTLLALWWEPPAG